MAKTQYSFSTDPTLLGAPSGHIVTVRELRLSAGAEFIVVITGDIMTMPGLPKVPSANAIRLTLSIQWTHARATSSRRMASCSQSVTSDSRTPHTASDARYGSSLRKTWVISLSRGPGCWPGVRVLMSL
jgi:hypothetical protein